VTERLDLDALIAAERADTPDTQNQVASLERLAHDLSSGQAALDLPSDPLQVASLTTGAKLLTTLALVGSLGGATAWWLPRARITKTAPDPLPRDRGSSFDAELELLGRAKREMNAGRTHLASVWLAEHRQRFPRGVFSAERQALTTMVDCAAASSQKKAALLQAFKARFPRSPLLDRVRKRCQPERKSSPEK
jgi:hypothetical protein